MRGNVKTVLNKKMFKDLHEISLEPERESFPPLALGVGTWVGVGQVG